VCVILCTSLGKNVPTRAPRVPSTCLLRILVSFPADTININIRVHAEKPRRMKRIGRKRGSPRSQIHSRRARRARKAWNERRAESRECDRITRRSSVTPICRIARCVPAQRGRRGVEDRFLKSYGAVLPSASSQGGSQVRRWQPFA